MKTRIATCNTSPVGAEVLTLPRVADMNPWKQGLQPVRKTQVVFSLLLCCRYESMKTRIATRTLITNIAGLLLWLQIWIHENKDCNLAVVDVVRDSRKVADMNPWKQGLQPHTRRAYYLSIPVLQIWIHENKDCNILILSRSHPRATSCRHESMKTRIATGCMV